MKSEKAKLSFTFISEQGDGLFKRIVLGTLSKMYSWYMRARSPKISADQLQTAVWITECKKILPSATVNVSPSDSWQCQIPMIVLPRDSSVDDERKAFEMIEKWPLRHATIVEKP
jgi:hypothetical protein